MRVRRLRRHERDGVVYGNRRRTYAEVSESLKRSLLKQRRTLSAIYRVVFLSHLKIAGDNAKRKMPPKRTTFVEPVRQGVRRTRFGLG